MGVLVPGGDRTAVRRTAEFFLKNFEVSCQVPSCLLTYVGCVQLAAPAGVANIGILSSSIGCSFLVSSTCCVVKVQVSLSL